MSTPLPTHPQIPIVDFGVFVDDDDARDGKDSGEIAKEKERVARDIDDAFREVGFVYLRNFGIGREVVAECFEWSKKFFDLPLETKMLAPHPPDGAHHRGYSAPGVEKVSQHVYDEGEIAKLREIPDYKESFESGNPSDTTQPNIWPPPTILPGFQPALEAYFTHCSTLVHRILSALTLALRLNLASTTQTIPDLSSTHAASLFQLRLLHYPPLSRSELRGGKRSRINAHSDFGTLTLLFQDDVGGLEVLPPSSSSSSSFSSPPSQQNKQEGEKEEQTFIPAPPIPSTVLVNIGDLLARWSNERWKSTVHRVGVPPSPPPPSSPPAYPQTSSPASPASDDKKDKDNKDDDPTIPPRYSIPFFATADPDTLIDALPGCWGDADPKKYEPVTAGEYVLMRMRALYGGVKGGGGE